MEQPVYDISPSKMNNFIQILFFEILIVFHDFDNQNLINVMYFGSFFNDSNTGTSLYFKMGIFEANSGLALAILPQTMDPPISNDTMLFE